MRLTFAQGQTIFKGSEIIDKLESKDLTRTDKVALITKNFKLLKAYEEIRLSYGVKEGDIVINQGQAFKLMKLYVRPLLSSNPDGEYVVYADVKDFDGSMIDAKELSHYKAMSKEC